MASTYQSLDISDFSGGWNPRDAWGAVADNESPDMINVTLDERGGAVKRLGLQRLNASDQIASTGNIQSLHYSKAVDRILAQIGSGLYVSSDGGSTWGASIRTFSSSARCHMVDYLGQVVIIHPVDRCFSYNGTTISGPIANSPAGSCCAVWNNAIWSVGDPAAPSRLTRSDNGAITWPASPVTADLRYVNDQPLTAIGGGQGMDNQGRDGLLAFKEDSHYWIYDSATGAARVLDTEYGASGPQCVTTNYGYTAALSKKGIVLISPGGTSSRYASTKIEPLFRPGQITMANASTMVAANYGADRMVFSLPWDTATTNSLTLEFSPQQGWFAPHNFGLSAATVYSKNTSKLYGGKVGNGASTYGYLLDVFASGADDGSDISSRIQTRWFEPNGGNDVRFRRAVINGRGRFTFYTKLDYEGGAGQSSAIDLGGDIPVWNGSTWGGTTWGATLQQSHAEIFSLGFGRAISFEIRETSSITANSPNLLDDGAASTVGGWGFYGLSVDMVPLGHS